LAGDGATRSAENTGIAFADAIAHDIAIEPHPLTTNEMETNVVVIQHPVMTNQGLAVLGTLGLFSREFTPTGPGAAGPGAYHWTKSPGGPGELRSCVSVAPIQIQAVVGAHRIGRLGIAFAPGEIFSNISTVLKSERKQNDAPVGSRAEPPAFEVTTNPYTFGQAPDWMPDGVHVVHHADRGEGNQIYVAKLDGSDERCLTCGQPGPNMVPDSRPQGDVILFHSW